MAYVFGLLTADGAIEDVRKSSRTCYVCIGSKDRILIEDVRKCLSSNHRIYTRKPQLNSYPNGKMYLNSTFYYLRIGSKKMFQNLIDLGLTPRKSLTIKLPDVPDNYFGYFLRGYFDGDGCINLYQLNIQSKIRIKVIFTSGSKIYLTQLSKRLNRLIKTSNLNITRNGDAFRLTYRKKDSLKVLAYMYKNLDLAPYLERKYLIYQNYLSKQQ